MPVTIPQSDSTILTATVEGMHAEVEGQINALPSSLQRPAMLNEFQVPGIVVDCDWSEVSTDQALTTTPTPFSEDASLIDTTWQHLTAYDLDNAGMGYSLPAGLVLIWCTVRVKRYSSTMLSVPEYDYMAWLNLNCVIDGVRDVSWDESGLITGQGAGATPGANYYWSIEDTFTMFKVVELAAPATLNSIELWGALTTGDSAIVALDVTLKEGMIAFIAFGVPGD